MYILIMSNTSNTSKTSKTSNTSKTSKTSNTSKTSKTSKPSIMTINNYLLFQFLKLYLHDEKFDKFDYEKYEKSSNYGKFGGYGGFKWSNKMDISHEKKSLNPIDFEQPIDPLDTIFMFHDYKLSISKSKWDSFSYNKDAASSVLYLSRNYRIINLLTRMLSTPFIFLFSLTNTIHKTEYDEINNKVLNLDAEFRSYLKSLYEQNK